MKKTGWLIFAIEIGISLVLAVIDYKLTTGFILGTLVSIVLYFRNNSFWNYVLDTRIAGKRTGTSISVRSVWSCLLLWIYFGSTGSGL